MANMNLWGAMLKSNTSFLSKSLLFLRAGATEKPALVRLEFDAEQQMVIAEFESKEGLPTTALFPINAVAYIVPKPKQAQLATGFSVPVRPADPTPIPAMPAKPTPKTIPPHIPASGPTPEEAAKIRADYKARNAAPLATLAPLTDLERETMGLTAAPTPVATKVSIKKAFPDEPADTVPTPAAQGSDVADVAAPEQQTPSEELEEKKANRNAADRARRKKKKKSTKKKRK